MLWFFLTDRNIMSDCGRLPYKLSWNLREVIPTLGLPLKIRLNVVRCSKLIIDPIGAFVSIGLQIAFSK